MTGFGQKSWRVLAPVARHNDTMPDKPFHGVPNRLRAIREELGLSRTEMAEWLGVGRTRWGNWEGGPDKAGNYPDEDVMIELCHRLDLTMDYIYRGKSDLIPLARAINLKAREMGMDPRAVEFDREAALAAVMASMVRGSAKRS